MRTPPPRTGDEREMLEAFLEFHRQTLLEKCMDLAPAQLATRAVAPSALSLQGLVRHMARVERWWFRTYLLGMRLPRLYVSKEEPDLDFDGVDPARWQDDLEVYRGEVTAARDAVLYLPLDSLSKTDFGDPVSLRFIFVHMIAEYARHNGHADLMREAVDGRTGF
jgi:uncharacterized damage-inducible protein DinB